MSTYPTSAWLAALHTSSRRLRETVGRLSAEELAGPSHAAGWSIARVLSHLGSAAEISTALVRRGIAEDTRTPVRKELLPIWERWDALPAPAQRDAWHEADTAHLALLDWLDAQERASVKVPYFSGAVGIGTYAGYRLSEQSVHAWDIEAALDEAAAIPAPEVLLLWERLDLVATRFRDGETLSRLEPRQVAVLWTDPARTWCLEVAGELHLYPYEPAAPTATLSGPAEALLRLVYGRNRARDNVAASGSVTLEDLRSLFPGY